MNAVVNPLAEAGASPVVPSARPSTMNGTLGVLINGKEFSDIVMERAARRLTEELGIGEVLWWNKRYPATPASTAFLDEIAERCTFVLNGIGH